ncbi:MAG: phospho-N-acetylmuramoyl-pentapeptide-transferase [Candidatus Jettenia sp.]|uniref:phospho-N-acetylmuramoyl-pentapeptide- transferase n=1 Tax=Candidatus Jettenia sp. AMX1 TaxID=2293637 RepID=UPI00058F3DB2|nr:phospho-N-acetylmuramoyl-pentapeptide-transferase [Candidatus Jettenia sp. AMX1]MBC6929906.1 phospho-N-acetylmuramoyl-pentapeptide-transferase [Candidatus Jettenia sp.]NUN24619.1 phospho-N-acetylmuramoyl-pentapeptide-transferase [Candidatus Jettenia caeni]KAA0248518.1 MAG: phospho-N-acetylmuramoyl-pentapeptide-transferase [Candidatus Jettenia sp. AMX1]MCE7881838.1 phospho-N-acetylmuramoyl-pentapeptide-transferase [Candidatus Jettenia sp. AMX1]MCQ3928206.1 phospho-N-acetylmuramoyl-pentapepti
MLYHWFSLEIFESVAFRLCFAAFTAFFISIFFGHWFIKKLRSLKIGEDTTKTDSEELKRMHSSKKNTPTMGGTIVIVAILISTLLWCNVYNGYVLLLMFTLIWFGALGFIDDYIKLTQKDAPGLSDMSKFLFQSALGLVLGLILYFHFNKFTWGTQIVIPFIKEFKPDLGPFYILVVTFFIVAMSNAVNLTDGLDGLAIGCSIIAGAVFTVIAYISGNVDFSNYLNIPYIAGSQELSVFCAALAGGGLGFLWYNCFPAQVFMGDTGSLALGGVLGLVAIIVKQEVVMIVIGGIFIAETISVIMQVSFYKMTKKRIFRCAPLHHHFQFKGLSETKVTFRFWIIAVLLAGFSFILL